MSDDMWECYERTGNPMYVWRALASASVNKRALPDWIAEYLRRSAVAMCRAQGTPQERAGAVLKNLGLIVGNKNAFHEYDKDNAAAVVAMDSEYYGGGDNAAEILAIEQGARMDNEFAAKKIKLKRLVKRAKNSGRYTE